MLRANLETAWCFSVGYAHPKSRRRRFPNAEALGYSHLSSGSEFVNSQKALGQLDPTRESDRNNSLLNREVNQFGAIV